MKLVNARYILLAIFFLGLTSFFYLRQIHHFKFVDEEDNFSIGRYVASGEKIYDDLDTNHQPLTYILSATVQKFFPVDSTYLLISRHRQFMVIWAFAWSLLLIWYFGPSALIFVVIYELTKIQLLGNLFLAESQAVYPLAYLIGSVFFPHKRSAGLELFFWGICFGVTLFLLSPIWPALLMLIVIKTHQGRNHLLRTSFFKDAGILIVTLAVFYSSSFSGYLQQALYDNFKFTIPAYQSEPFVSSALKSFLTPVLAVFPYPATVTLWVIRIGLTILILALLSKKISLGKSLGLFLLLGLLNLRFIWPGTEGYSGFHLLPWYGAFLFILSQAVKFRSRLNVALLIVLLGIIVYYSRGSLFLKRDDLADYNINYSTQTSLGEVIKIMKDRNDTLFVSQLSSILYWQSSIDHLPKLYGYYPWLMAVPNLHQGIIKAFENTPPTFFYCDNCRGLDLEKYLTKYDEIKRASGGGTYLYVLKSKAGGLTNAQRSKLGYYKYKVD